MAGAMFLPVVVWNSQHDWASFRFQFVDRFAQHSFHFRHVLRFFEAQLLVATPLLAAGSVWLYARLARSRRRLLTPRWWLAVCFSLPLLLALGHKALRYDVRLNWSLPLYAGLLPALAHTALARERLRRRRPAVRSWLPAGYGTVAACAAFGAIAVTFLFTLQPRLQWISAFGPWPALARALEAAEETVERQGPGEPLIVANGKYRLASVLAFYRSPLENTVRASDQTTANWVLEGQGLGFPYWHNAEAWRQAPRIIFIGPRGVLPELRRHFERIEPIHEPLLRTCPKYQIFLCEGWRA
jgi:hypothetical protein